MIETSTMKIRPFLISDFIVFPAGRRSSKYKWYLFFEHFGERLTRNIRVSNIKTSWEVLIYSLHPTRPTSINLLSCKFSVVFPIIPTSFIRLLISQSRQTKKFFNLVQIVELVKNSDEFIEQKISGSNQSQIDIINLPFCWPLENMCLIWY